MKCNKAGVKIHETRQRQRQHVSFQNTSLNQLDLEIDNYSAEDLYNLFNITDIQLSDDILKNAKQIVLKMHPDKSGLDSKYFIFFSNAYKRLFNIYEFQNKTSKKRSSQEDYYDETNKTILDNMFKNKEFEDPKNFNSWFNKAFENHRVDDPNAEGYGEWLKSNDDFIDINENVTKGNMNDIFEKKKKQVQAMTVYNGIQDSMSSTFGGSLLNGSDAGSSYYTDLREAYTQTLIPVTQEDYDKIPKFKNLNEYNTHRNKIDVKPISEKEAQHKLYEIQKKQEHESVALAYKLAKDAEKAQKSQNSFWSDLKQITGW
jgi:hypothetical protein